MASEMAVRVSTDLNPSIQFDSKTHFVKRRLSADQVRERVESWTEIDLSRDVSLEPFSEFFSSGYNLAFDTT